MTIFDKLKLSLSWRTRTEKEEKKDLTNKIFFYSFNRRKSYKSFFMRAIANLGWLVGRKQEQKKKIKNVIYSIKTYSCNKVEVDGYCEGYC